MKTIIVSTNVYLVQQAIELGAVMLPFLCALLVVSWINYKENTSC